MKMMLASSSPRRKELLKNLGFELRIAYPEINEESLPEERPEDLVLRLSQQKAAAVKADQENYILAADTIVVCAGQILGKPKDKEEARIFLKKLSNVSHEVLTGFTLLKDQKSHSQVVKTQIWFRCLGESEIESYIHTEEPYDKAGGYAIQGVAAAFIDRIEGSFTNVIGLPLKEVLDSLELFSHE